MKWFLLVLVVASHQQGDLWITNPERNQTYVAMPSKEVCEQVQAMNYNSTCWAKVESPPQSPPVSLYR